MKMERVEERKRSKMNRREIEEIIRDFYIDNNFHGYHVSLGIVLRENIFGKIKKVILISNKPGIIIGFHGETIDKLEEKLKGIEIDIKEIYSPGYNFINI